jgi:hypothetical protein
VLTEIASSPAKEKRYLCHLDIQAGLLARIEHGYLTRPRLARLLGASQGQSLGTLAGFNG